MCFVALYSQCYFNIQNKKMKQLFYNQAFIKYVLLLVILSFSKLMNAEGTSSISPDSTIISALSILPSQNRGNFLDCPKDNRIYFRVNDHTIENFYLGFNWRNYSSIIGTNPAIADVFMRIYSPGGTLLSQINLPSSGNGHINTWSEATIGANITGSTMGGYAPLSFDPDSNGAYYINLYRSADGGVTQLPSNVLCYSPFWDFQIANTAGIRYNGRVYCSKWALNAVHPTSFYTNSDQKATPSIFALSDDSCTVKFQVNDEFKPISFDLVVNKYGINNTGNFNVDRISSNNATSPTFIDGFKLFLNVPDNIAFPSGSIPLRPKLMSPALIGCSSSYSIRYTVYEKGDVRLLLDLNGINGYQSNTSDLIIEQFNVVPGLNTISWNGLNGLGNPVNSGSQFKLVLSFLKGRFNFPIYDGEINKFGMNISSILPINNANLKVYWDDSPLTNIGTTCSSPAEFGNNTTGAGTSNLFLGENSPCHAWSGNGNLTQTIPALAVGSNESNNLQCDDFGNARTINTFGWGVEVKDSVTVTLNCLQITGTIWNDRNGSANGTNSNIYSLGEVGTTMGIPMYVVLIDPVTHLVLQSVAVNANGTYTLNAVPTNGIGMQILLASNIAVMNNLPPSASINSNWISTSPLSQIVNTATSNLSGLDFGVTTHNAINDFTTSLKNAIVTGNVSNNDTILLNSIYSVIGTPSKGSIVMTSAGNFTYTPIVNAIGTDSVRYQVCSSSPMNICDTANLFFAINSVNAVDDIDTTNVNISSVISVLGNDTDPQGNAISNPTIVVNPMHGTVVVNANGSILYTPITGYTGNDFFQYRITDNGIPVASDTALVSINMYKPTFIANADINNTITGTIVTGNVATNDVILPGTIYTKLDSLNTGNLVLNSNGTYIYTPTFNFEGKDEIEYIITSPPPMNIKDTSTISFIIINEYVNGTNSISAQIDQATTAFNQSIELCILCNDNDPQLDSILMPTILTNPLNGTISFISNKTVTYTPNSNFVGTDKFTYSICDYNINSTCDSTTVFIEVSSQPISINQTYANDDSYITLENATFISNLGLNDFDPQYDNFTFAKVSEPVHGIVSLNTDGIFIYTPELGYSGPDKFIYRICDDAISSVCDTATAYFNMLKLNAALPVVFGDFRVLENNCIVHINWNTIEERNVSKYNIERKLNHSTFEVIGTVNAKGNNSANQSYHFVDRMATSGINEYRLVAIDFDEQSMKSSTKWINLNCINKDEVSLYPNPTNNNIQLSLSTLNETIFDIKIIDAIGKIVYSASFETKNNKKIIDIPTFNFSSGIYTVILNNGNESQIIKFSKN